MKTKLSLLLIFSIILTACAPKQKYVREDQPIPLFDEIWVVAEYLHFIDDVGKAFDYPYNINQERLEDVKQKALDLLRDKGFRGDIKIAIVSSGMGLDPEMAFEHYIDRKLQDALINPPFYLESDLDEALKVQFMQSFAEAQSIAVTGYTSKTLDAFKANRLTPIRFPDEAMADQPEEKSIGILHIRAVAPRVSFVKSIGVSLLTAGVSGGVSGGSYVVVATPYGVKHSTGLLFDNLTGEIIWKNMYLHDASRRDRWSNSDFGRSFPEL